LQAWSGSQSTVPPQPSGWLPQVKPAQALAAGVQPHALATPPPPQLFGATQPPQSWVPLQPSGMGPHLPVQSKTGVQTHVPGCPATLDEQWKGAVQVPQV